MRRSILALLLAAVLLPAILIGYGAIQAKPLYILMYHHLVPDGTTCNDWTVTESHFRADLQWLSDHRPILLSMNTSLSVSPPSMAQPISDRDLDK